MVRIIKKMFRVKNQKTYMRVQLYYEIGRVCSRIMIVHTPIRADILYKRMIHTPPKAFLRSFRKIEDFTLTSLSLKRKQK